MPSNQFLLFSFSREELGLDQNRLLAAAGYPEGASPAGRVLESLSRAEKMLRELMRPRAAVRYVRLAFRGGEAPGFGLAGGLVFNSRLITAPLSAGCAWAFFAVTIGGEASEISAKTCDSDFLLSFLLDTTASCFAESLADLLQEKLAEKAAEKGLATGWRFSPGYCDWELAENRDLLSAVGAEQIGIRLTDGGMMVPQKSVSGVMGFGLPGSGVEKSPCVKCRNASCTHRRGAKKQ
ncbi:MAG: vitamin B12 dependent-methionine synthase activation domain-containing protein [Thermodesulfobacteriota bacterium]